MKGYRLAPVRDARDRDERVKRGDLAGAVGDAEATAAGVAAAAERVAACRAEIAAALAARDAAVAAGATGARLAAIERYLARRRGELESLADAHARASAAHRGRLDEVDTARARLARARADRQVIERHFERWRGEQQKRAERRED